MLLTDVSFHLRDLNHELVTAWEATFTHLPNFEISQGPIFDVRADAVVSPANSFGFMDGGIDLVYSRHFGWDLQERLREIIFEHFHGELPVGCATTVPTHNDDIPHLISAPTMRLPMPIPQRPNAFLAFRAVLIEVERYNAQHPNAPIQSVLCPGLATGIGMVTPELCARQMALAYDAIALQNPVRTGGLYRASQHFLHMIGRETEIKF